MKFKGQEYKGPRQTCNGCTKRHPACHDSCNEYIEARAEWDAWRRDMRRKKYLAKQVISHQIETVEKNKRR